MKNIIGMMAALKPMCTLLSGEEVYLGEDEKIDALMKAIIRDLEESEYIHEEEQHSFHCEPNRKIKGHPQPFYHKGRW